MTAKKTAIEFKKEIFDRVGNEYTVLGEYERDKILVEMKHNICGHIWNANPGNFLRGSRCPNCNKMKWKRSTNQFKKDIFSEFGDEYIVLSNYIDIDTFVKIRHKTCGNIMEITPREFFIKKECNMCMKNKSLSLEYMEYIYENDLLGCKNKFKYGIIEEDEVAIVTTNGKNKVEFIVDSALWKSELHKYSWTAIVGRYRIDVKTSKKGISKSIGRIIGEMIFDELEIYGRNIDHINVNNLDNRVRNLRCVSPQVNMNNKKNIKDLLENDYIQIIPKETGIKYNFQMVINGKKYSKYFQTKEEAIKYRNNIIIKNKATEIKNIIKKDRDIEFERGLKEKLESNEILDIIKIFKKHKINIG